MLRFNFKYIINGFLRFKVNFIWRKQP